MVFSVRELSRLIILSSWMSWMLFLLSLIIVRMHLPFCLKPLHNFKSAVLIFSTEQLQKLSVRAFKCEHHSIMNIKLLVVISYNIVFGLCERLHCSLLTCVAFSRCNRLHVLRSDVQVLYTMVLLSQKVSYTGYHNTVSVADWFKR